jgi:hypothetical protein
MVANDLTGFHPDSSKRFASQKTREFVETDQ